MIERKYANSISKSCHIISYDIGILYRIQILCLTSLSSNTICYSRIKDTSAVCERQHKSIYVPLSRARRLLRTFVDPLRCLRIATNPLPTQCRISGSFSFSNGSVALIYCRGFFGVVAIFLLLKH